MTEIIVPDTTLKPKKFRWTPQQERARDKLASDATDIALGGGSRSGKTTTFIGALCARALRVPNSRHAALRFRQNAIVQAIVYDTFPKTMELLWPGSYNSRMLNKEMWFYTFPNGSELWFGGLDDKERVEKILGNEYATIFFNEISQIPYTSVTMALTRLAQVCYDNMGRQLALKAYYDFNPPSKRHWSYRLFIDKVNPETGRPLLRPADYDFLFMNPADNAENLDKRYLERLDGLPDRERRRFLLGQFAEETNDALWTEEVYDATRFLPSARQPLVDMVRIVIGVDPSGCTGEEDERSDEVGIVVVGLGIDGHAYLLEDLSGHYGPSTWGQIVADAFERQSADRVVAEKNFGGAMVAHTIEVVNSVIPVTLVQASRGKVVRAEPVSALYEKGKVHHVGYYPELEGQGCDFFPDGYKGSKSPDRKDSLIWAITELFPGLTRENAAGDRDVIPKVHTAPRAASAHARRAPQPHRRRP